jgi:hypothetical protein
MRYLGKNGWTPKKLYHFGKRLGLLFKKPRRLSRAEANRYVMDEFKGCKKITITRRPVTAVKRGIVMRFGMPVRPTIKADK